MLKSAAVIAAAVVSALLAAHLVQSLRTGDTNAVATARASVPTTRISGDPTPAAVGRPASLVKQPDGHFWAEATVNGKAVRFLVDTGATTVALTAADAKRLGLDLDEMTFDRPVHTAAGEVKAAMVELDYVSVAGARVEKVQTLVLKEGLPHSLLGMSYLGRLSRFEATPTSLILRP